MKKRNKKYIPLDQKRNNALRGKLAQTYEFSMDFCIEDVNKAIDEWRSENNLNEDQYCPEWLVIGAYGQQDLIIAWKMMQIQNPVYYHIGIDTYFYNATTDNVKTISFNIELPEMSHTELMNGCEVKVDRGSGLKTRWKGLQPEMIDNWETENNDGYDVVRSMVRIVAHAKFKNASLYLEHETMLKMRDNGTLIDNLRG